MRVVNVSNEYGISTIGANSQLWRGMLKNVIDNNDDKVIFDFKDVKLNQPWKNDYFKMFITDKRVCMRVYNNDKLKKNIDALIIFSNNDIDGKVENIVEVDDSVESAKTKQIKNLTSRFLDRLVYRDDNGVGVVRFDVGKDITQIEGNEAVEAIRKALESFIDTYNGKIKKIEVNFTDVIIGQHCFKYLAKMACDFINKGLMYEELDTSYDKIKKLAKYRLLLDSMKLSEIDKYNIIKNDITPGTVVMLHMFKETKSVNEFGQMNDGQYTISRPAIFLGYKKDGNNVVLSFRSYLKNTFFTKIGYYIENGTEDELEGLETKTYNIKLNEIGYSEKFTGRRGHFHLPLQFDKEDMIESYVNEGGAAVKKSLTLPEYIKEVFDDNEVRYDKDKLDICINMTNKWLGIDED